MKYKVLTTILKTHGFYFIRQGKGSHEIWGNSRRTMSVPKSREVNNMLAKRLISEAKVG